MVGGRRAVAPPHEAAVGPPCCPLQASASRPLRGQRGAFVLPGVGVLRPCGAAEEEEVAGPSPSSPLWVRLGQRDAPFLPPSRSRSLAGIGHLRPPFSCPRLAGGGAVLCSVWRGRAASCEGGESGGPPQGKGMFGLGAGRLDRIGPLKSSMSRLSFACCWGNLYQEPSRALPTRPASCWSQRPAAFGSSSSLAGLPPTPARRHLPWCSAEQWAKPPPPDSAPPPASAGEPPPLPRPG